MVTMSTKVLVFESDSGFAGELRTELEQLGCDVRVVDDGNVGLAQAQAERPDLVLLSIELPRMNGFSVCNKLKKDANLKEVPLIIMSSESSDETFDQHKKLRTRAEAYVHKPITWQTLLREIQNFVALEGEVTTSTADIQIDDVDVEVPPESDAGSHTEILQRPVFAHVDPEVDSFADAAFGRLQTSAAPGEDESQVVGEALAHSPAPPEPRRSSPPARGSVAPARGSVTPPPRASSLPPRPSTPPPIPASVPPPSNGSAGRAAEALAEAEAKARIAAAQSLELEDVRAQLGRASGELSQATTRQGELEKQLRDAETAAARAREEAQAEADNLKRDLEELRSRLSAASAPAGNGSIPPKAGGVSSREFLDLRETLSKKDKELLALKTQLAAKDKEVFEIRDRALGLEGRASELDDKVLAKDRELAEAQEQIETLTGELETTKKVAADTQGDLDRVQKELEAVVQTRAQENTAHEAAEKALKAELDTERRAREEAVQALSEATTRFTAESEAAAARHASESEAALATLTEAKRAHAAEVAEAQQKHAAEIDEARSKHAAEIDETRSKLTAELEDARRKHAAELDETRSRHTSETEAAAGAHAAALAEQKEEAQGKLAAAESSHREEAQRLRASAEARESELNADLAKAAERQSDTEKLLADAITTRTSLAGQLSLAQSKAQALEEELGVLRGELDETRKNLTRETSRATRAQAKWDADRASLERAKDALAVALSQLDEAEARQITD